MIKNPALPNGFVLFCDDVRVEANGKFLFIGVYQHDMIFNLDPPWALSQLATQFWYRTGPSEIPRHVEFRIIFEENDQDDGIILYSHLVELTDDKLPKGPPPSPKPNVTPYFEMGHTARLGPLMLPGPGLLRARVFSDGDELRLGTITVAYQKAEVNE